MVYDQMILTYPSSSRSNTLFSCGVGDCMSGV